MNYHAGTFFQCSVIEWRRSEWMKGRDGKEGVRKEPERVGKRDKLRIETH